MNILGKAVTRTRVGYSAGFRFVGDNKVVPVLNHGLFDRFEGPGHFWIAPYEELLGPIHIGIQAAEFDFLHVLTKDQIPHKISLNLVYQQNPTRTQREIQPGLARLPAKALRNIIKNQANSGLRLIFAQYDSAQIIRPGIKLEIQIELYRRLSALMKWAGVTFIQQEVLLKEIVPPKFYLQSVLNDYDLKLLLRLARESGSPELMERMSQIHKRYGLAAAGNKQIHYVDNADEVGYGDYNGNGQSRPSKGRDPYSGPYFPRFPN